MSEVTNRKVFQILVDNNSGVLSRISGLFSRRGYNIESITAGVTAEPTITRITVVTSGDNDIMEQIEKQLNKKLDVIKVKTFDETESINRELMLVKVRYNRSNRKDIMENCEIMAAKIVDMSKTMMTIQMCDTPERVQIFLDTLRTVSIIEIARTGALALLKCSEQGK